MKKLIFVFFLSFTVILTFADSQIRIFKFKNESFKPLKKFHIVGSYTTPQGCHYSYDLILDVGLVPPRFNSLTGTITSTGNCTGTQTINITSLRGVVDPQTYETSNFKIDETIFQNTAEQERFEKVLENQINNERDQIWR